MFKISQKIAVLTLAVLVFTACEIPFISENLTPDQVLTRADEKIQNEITSFTYKADVKITDNKQKIALRSGSATITGQFDKSDANQIISSSNTKGSLSFANRIFPFEIDAVTQGALMYVKPSEATLEILQNFIPSAEKVIDFEEITGKWILMSSYTDILNTWNALEESDPDEATDDLTEQEVEDLQNVEIVYLYSTYFNLEEQLEDETLNGKDVYHYNVKLNQQGIVEANKKVSEEAGEPMTADEILALNNFLSAFSNSAGEIWIGKDDFYVYKINMDIKYIEPKYNADILVEIDATLNNHNQPVTVTVPSGNQVIDTNDIFKPADEIAAEADEIIKNAEDYLDETEGEELIEKVIKRRTGGE